MKPILLCAMAASIFAAGCSFRSERVVQPAPATTTTQRTTTVSSDPMTTPTTTTTTTYTTPAR
jgi:hypothetical protein